MAVKVGLPQPACMTSRFCQHFKRREQGQTDVLVSWRGVRSDQSYDRQLALLGPLLEDFPRARSPGPVSAQAVENSCLSCESSSGYFANAFLTIKASSRKRWSMGCERVTPKLVTSVVAVLLSSALLPNWTRHGVKRSVRSRQPGSQEIEARGSRLAAFR
jgi:hypothetical protein